MTASALTTPISLDCLHKGQSGVVADVADSSATLPLDAIRRLLELGFVAGERVRVLAEAFPHGDPMAVCVAGTRFALRRLEASAVWITPDLA